MGRRSRRRRPKYKGNAALLKSKNTEELDIHTLQEVAEHVARRFELTYAGGLAESVAALPKLTPRRRRTREVAAGSSVATSRPQDSAGKLRRVV